MMKAVVLVVAVVASSVRGVQGQTSDPYTDLNKNKCPKKECTYNSLVERCLLVAGKGSFIRQGSKDTAPGKYW